MDDKPLYKPCWKGLTIRLPNGAYSFAHCTLLVTDDASHEGPCQFSLVLYEMIRKDQVRL